MTNPKNNAALLFLVLALFCATAVFAHEGGKHFLGTVKAVDADSVTIVTKTNETVTLQLSPATKFVKGNQPASVQDLKTGERVVVHAKQNGTAWQAQEVHIGGSSPKAMKH